MKRPSISQNESTYPTSHLQLGDRMAVLLPTGQLFSTGLLCTLLASVFLLTACEPAEPAWAATLQAALESSLELEQLPQIAILVTDRDRTLWSSAAGSHDLEGTMPARSDSLFRVGSVSKLFTDLAIMKLVEDRMLDLDAPVTQYLSSFAPENRYGTPVTLRQLMSHRAGLLREPPVGHYFDDTVPTLQATVDSLNQTALVASPGAMTKYSNAGIAVVGRVLEVVTGKPFEDAVTELVLGPLRMTSSRFSAPTAAERVPEAAMWTSFGRKFPAPSFELGMAPAGSLYTSLEDLGLFMRALMRDGGVVEPDSLAEMLTPQFAEADENGARPESGFGLGFAIDRLGENRRIGHGGAIYGFATQLSVLPDSGIGVAVVATQDFGNAVSSRVAEIALEAVLDPDRDAPTFQSLLSAAEIEQLQGTYSSEAATLDLIRRGDRLWVHGTPYPAELRRRGNAFILGGLTGNGAILIPDPQSSPSSFTLGNRVWQRSTALPEPAPERWRDLLGEYGWDHNVLVILERAGQLHALIEWFELNALEEVAEDRFAFSERPSWLYHHEQLRFERDDAGRVVAALVGAVRFERRAVGAEDGGTFRIEPVQEISTLRATAASASPPNEDGDFRTGELIELIDVDPTLALDIRYATTNNFMGAAFYAQPRAFLQRPAAEALARVQKSLAGVGYGLLIHDAYRPWSVTKMFWDATPEEHKVFVANPLNGSRHNRGCAVDLTLVSLETGEPILMTGGYDEFSDRSYPEYPGGDSLQRYHRQLLRQAMESEGFTVYEAEWWHFDHDDWRSYRIQNDAFEDLE